ncbi:MAG TPA: aminotransferase class V-fold PLP-dependent enzyme [Tepidisphaeraceae bacterium]|nr:aminotransferase class V-fold PLP-dependent enzyme [Tepidisphaeraceae bacterium]
MSDLADTIGNAEMFPVLRRWNFFNHAGVSPIPRAAADALHNFAEEAAGGAYLGTSWYPDLDKLRALAARLINAERDEIALVKNTSEGISIVANGLEWQRGDRIVTTAVEYPANVYPWMEVVRSRGAQLVMVPEETGHGGSRAVPLEQILHEAADPRTRIVTLSHVEFASGQRQDLAQIGAFCRATGKLFNVDAIQSIGAVPVDVKAMNIDYLSADGHKWMLGPEGAGIFYCRRELIERTRPLMLGAMNVINPLEYGSYDYTLKPDAGRFECGSMSLASFFSLKASLDMIESIGIANIALRVKLLTDRLVSRLVRKGYAVVSPRQGQQWSGIVSFASPNHTHEPIVRTLRRHHHTEIALREGRMRASPHFYNTEEQIDRLVDLLPEH